MSFCGGVFTVPPVLSWEECMTGSVIIWMPRDVRERPSNVAQGQSSSLLSAIPFITYGNTVLSLSMNLEALDEKTGLRLALDPSCSTPAV